MSEREQRTGAPPGDHDGQASPLEERTAATGAPLLNRWFPRGLPNPIQRGPGPAILMYHQVADLDDDLWSLAVKPAFFAEHLEILRRRCRPLGLPHLTTDMIRNQLDPRAVVVTFDDGYLDNLLNARPLLERYDVPATMFIVGGAIGRGQEFWWDQLQHMFLGDHPLPESLQLTLSGRKRSWQLSAQEAPLGLPTRWTRSRLHQTLWNELRMVPASERAEIIAILRDWTGQALDVRPERQVMNEAELLSVASGHLIEIGAHTATHPRMSALDPAEQFAEVQAGKTQLEEILGERVTSFSYPFGGSLDVSGASVEAVRLAGFARACTMRHAMVRPRTNLLRLPRLAVGNWSGEEFERRMDAWLPS